MVRGQDSFPAWTHTIGNMVMVTGPGFQVAVRCTACGCHRILDAAALQQLVYKVGVDYSLINRRCRCRFRRECPGWNRFFYQSGVMRPLWDGSAVARWLTG